MQLLVDGEDMSVTTCVQVVKVKGLSSVKGWSHYFAIISRVVLSDGEDRVDSVILGVDIRRDVDATAEAGAGGDDIIDDDDDDDDDDGLMTAETGATVGLVLPITSSLSVTVAGQGYVVASLTTSFIPLFTRSIRPLCKHFLCQTLSLSLFS